VKSFGKKLIKPILVGCGKVVRIFMDTGAFGFLDIICWPTAYRMNFTMAPYQKKCSFFINAITRPALIPLTCFWEHRKPIIKMPSLKEEVGVAFLISHH